MIVKKIGDSMITPLGFSLEENFAAVMAGQIGRASCRERVYDHV